jgi:predicted hotdog family 3-hydroxylacyl-ACP dehydratase
MNEEFKTKEATSELVPHKGKMLLLDRVQNYSLEDVNITTEIDISRNSLFYEDDLGGIPAWVAFEYMAQSISALSGIYGRTKGDKPKVGFIMSVSGFKADIPVFFRMMIEKKLQQGIDDAAVMLTQFPYTNWS